MCRHPTAPSPTPTLSSLRRLVIQPSYPAKPVCAHPICVCHLQAALYSVLAYNACLGGAVTRAEDAGEDLAAAVQQYDQEFGQLYQEKVAYMKRTAAAEVGVKYSFQIVCVMRIMCACVWWLCLGRGGSLVCPMCVCACVCAF